MHPHTNKINESFKINIFVEDDFKAQILEFINNNRDWLAKRIADDWSNRPGFWSNMDNRLQEWEKRFWVESCENDADFENYLANIIAYMMLKENNNIDDSIIYTTYERLNFSDYVEFISKENYH